MSIDFSDDVLPFADPAVLFIKIVDHSTKSLNKDRYKYMHTQK
jgi:hypothetical protein